MKLENIKLEDTVINTNNNSSNQKIISEYNFGKTKGLSEDRTFCLLNCCPTNYCKYDECRHDCDRYCYTFEPDCTHRK